jgi:hypothetical protein
MDFSFRSLAAFLFCGPFFVILEMHMEWHQHQLPQSNLEMV